MVQTTLKSLTLEEFFQLPETKPASEYIDNQIIQKPMPQGKHSATQCELIIFINAILKPKKVARYFPEIRRTFGGMSTVPRPLAKVLFINLLDGQDARPTRKNNFCGMGILPVLVIFARGLLMFQYLSGTEFPQMITVKLLMSFP